MNLSRARILSIYSVVLIGVAGNAQGALQFETIQYLESPDAFEWTMLIKDATMQPAQGVTFKPPNAQFWDPEINIHLSPFPLGDMDPDWTFSAQHISKALGHPGDAPEGELFAWTHSDESPFFAPLPIGEVELFSEIVTHPHNGEDHSDIYTFYYEGTTPTDVTARFVGVHVPTPGAMALLGLAGITNRRRRR